MLVTAQKSANFFVSFILPVILNLSLSRIIEFLITPERRKIRAGGNFSFLKLSSAIFCPSLSKERRQESPAK